MIQDGMISDAMKVRLRPGDRAVLEARLRAATTEQRQLLRIRIVLEAAEGHGTREIARELETTPTTVSLWRIRYAREGLDGLECQSAFKFDPAYCLICRCYPDGAVAADNPISTDRLCIVVFQARSRGGAVGGSGPT